MMLDTYREDKREMLVILGATASGKTALAVALAAEGGGEIISADSRQVFRGMDIGSGKDLHEYGGVPYHLIDILAAGEEFSVFDFQRCFLQVYADIIARSAWPVLCGGSGMYLDAVLRGYHLPEVPRNEVLRRELADKTDDELVAELYRLKPHQHNSTDLLERARTIRAIEIARGELEGSAVLRTMPQISSVVIGIRRSREETRRRITSRLAARFANGMIEEVEQLHARGVSWQRLDYYGLEYRYCAAYLRGELTKNDMFQRLNSAIHTFAKRQEKWFRRMEEHGIVINWLDGDNELVPQAQKIIRK